MRSSAVSTTVAGILAVAGFAGAANAANVNIFVSGASAQRTFWEKDLAAICTGTFPASGTTGLTVSSSALPDIHLDTCTIASTRGTQIPIPTGLAAGDVLTMQYAAELGSVWGIAPLISTNNAHVGRRFLNAANCTGGTCTVTGYDRNADTAVSGLTAPTAIDMGVTDLEPTLWNTSHPDNWPTFSILQPQPTAAQIAAIGAYTRVNGQVFGLYVNSTNAATANLTNLSRNSATAILTGSYTTWDQVPELAGVAAASGVNIVVCRRDHGSGTEVSTSITFAGSECGATGAPIVSAAGFGNLNGPTITTAAGTVANPNEVFSSTDMGACLTAAGNNAPSSDASGGTAPIGIRSLAAVTGARLLNLNGVEPNAHNAASGASPYAYDTFARNNTANTQPGTKAASLVTALITDAQNPARLAAEVGNNSATGWTGTTGVTNAQASYGLDNGAVSASGDWAVNSGKAPRELYNQNGNSCSARNNDNQP